MEIKTLNDVKRLMSDNETDSVEYKATTGQLEHGMETLCAFLNGSGGSVSAQPGKRSARYRSMIGSVSGKDIRHPGRRWRTSPAGQVSAFRRFNCPAGKDMGRDGFYFL